MSLKRSSKLFLLAFVWGAMLPGSPPFALGPTTIESYQWKKRLVLVFYEADDEARVREQRAALNDDAGLSDRDVLVFGYRYDAAMRRRVRVAQRGFAVVLIGKDGGVKVRRTKPVSSKELYRIIDAMPMRKAEQRDKQR